MADWTDAEIDELIIKYKEAYPDVARAVTNLVDLSKNLEALCGTLIRQLVEEYEKARSGSN